MEWFQTLHDEYFDGKAIFKFHVILNKSIGDGELPKVYVENMNFADYFLGALFYITI